MRSLLISGCVCFAVCMSSGCSRNEQQPDVDAQQLSALQARIEQLETQIGEAKDVSEIKKLQRAYGYYLDRGLADDMADLFTKNEPRAEYGSGGVFATQDSIRKAFHALIPGNRLADGVMTTHMQLQGVVNVDAGGSTAKARWRAFAMTAHDGHAFWQEGPYEMEYIKEDGIWKIKDLRWYQTFTVPYEGGWAQQRPKQLTSATGTSLPKPDLPSRGEKRAIWPEVDVLPYHYKNPVTGR